MIFLKRFFTLIFLLLLPFFQLAAQNAPDKETLPPALLEIQSEIDSAVLMRSSESVSQILKNHKDDENYPEIENLVLEKARNLALDEDFEFAKNLAMAVIENNIENFEAIDLYSSIEKSLANERAYKRNLELHSHSRRTEED